MWNIGESLVKQNKTPEGEPGKYRQIYLDRKEVEVEKAEQEGLKVVPSAEIRGREGFRSKKHVHNRARRYMEKGFLWDLWKAWNEIA